MAPSGDFSSLPLIAGVDLTGKVAIVTGAGMGVGRATSRVFAQAGCSVVAADIDPGAAEKTAREIEAAGFPAIAVPTDVAQRVDAERLARVAVEAYGTIDILANVAGIYPASLVVDMDEAEWDRVFAINAKGVFNCCQAAAPTMIAQRSGKIVNVASTDGMHPGIFPGQSGYGNAHYCASKAAVITFTKSLAAELAPFGINVNAISPGWVATEKALAGGRFEEGLRHVPLGRGSRTEEVGQAILFLVSEAAAFMTGENLVFSGGSVMD
jgi:NAD(P)-dependent dehydrogenase (short-subunit alcohol dehydrogenase family)